MTPDSVQPGWYPLILARALGSRPVRRSLAGTELTLARTEDAAPCVREVSTGRHRAVRQVDGLIFVAHADPPSECSPKADHARPPRSGTLVYGQVRANIRDVGENILDTTHTSVVHKNYLRRPGARRPVTPFVETGDDWITATYPPGAAPGGWGARLLGAQRYTIRDTFRAPSTAEVSYIQHGRPAFEARFYLTPAGPFETYVAAVINVPGRGLAAAFKLAALRLFFLRIFAEDRAILELIRANRAAHGAAPLVYAPQDLMRPGIDAVLAGRRPPAPAGPLALNV